MKRRLAIVIGVIVAGFFLVFLAMLIGVGVFHLQALVALYGVERWTVFVANLIVLVYAAAAFKRTRRVGFLYTAIAALIFAYTVVFGLLFPTTHNTLGQRQLYYVARQTIYIFGLGFYARGIMLLSQQV